MDTTIYVRLDGPDKRKLERIAKALTKQHGMKVGMSHVVRGFIHEGLEREKSRKG